MFILGFIVGVVVVTVVELVCFNLIVKKIADKSTFGG